MTRRVAVLRPEPGNAATCARVVAAGLAVIALPLFVVEPLPWTPPDPAGFDGLLLTSANSAAMAGPGLRVLSALPVLAVGTATARASAAAGLDVMMTGTSDAAALIAEAAARGFCSLLHLGGRETTVSASGIVARSVPVYASVARDVGDSAVAALAGSVALLHSARAAQRLAMLLDRSGIARKDVDLVAISHAVAQAAGSAWRSVAVAPAPTDAAIITVARQAAAGQLPSSPIDRFTAPGDKEP